MDKNNIDDRMYVYGEHKRKKEKILRMILRRENYLHTGHSFSFNSEDMLLLYNKTTTTTLYTLHNGQQKKDDKEGYQVFLI